MTKRNVLIEEGSVNGIVVFNRQDSWKSFMTLIEYLEPHSKENVLIVNSLLTQNIRFLKLSTR